MMNENLQKRRSPLIAACLHKYKDGSGDPIGFKSFLRQHNIPAGAFPRYVGNRLHILFHLAGIVILHEEKLREFVEKQCTAASALRSCILKDLSDDRIMLQVWGLSLLGKTVTGPWMTKFYSSTMSNLEAGSLFRCCLAQLQTWIEDPQAAIQPSSNVFKEDIDYNDEVVAALFGFTTNEVDLQPEVISCIYKSTASVLQRQLKAFVDGDFSEPSEAQMEFAASAPTHNMFSERALGSLDRLWRRAPNATMGFLNGKVRSKLNKTLAWLESKPNNEKVGIIEFSMKEARGLREKNLLDNVALQEEIAKCRKEVAVARHKSKKRALQLKLNRAFELKSTANLLCKKEVVKLVQNYMDTPNSIIGKLFLCKSGEDRYGRIQQVKKNNKLKISYWDLHLPESTSVDHPVSASCLYADVNLGHVVFI